MKRMIVIEEFAFLALSIFLFYKTKVAWWILPVFMLIPDISILGYLINKKIGAIIYNVSHHRAIAIVLFLCGRYFNNIILEVLGTILFAHSSIDRIFGLGFKYSDGFKHTHLDD